MLRNFKKNIYIGQPSFGQPSFGQPKFINLMLENLNKIQIGNPVDLIISQIRDLIISGSIKPGEKLPPERKLAEHFGVSRNQVREAINKLQIYGIVKVQPQSGTFIVGIGIVAIEGLITDILKLEKAEFSSLVDTRILLEKEAARLAAMHATTDDLVQINNALEDYEAKLMKNNAAVEEDLIFHIKIAEASKNTVLKTLMMIITPDIVKSFINLKVCDENNNRRTIEEHRHILNMIADKNPEGAENAMSQHLLDVKDFSDNMNL